MNMVGDGPEGQPTAPATLDELASQLGSEDADSGASDSEESEQPEDESEDAEAEESEDSDSEEEAEEAVFTIKVDGKEIALKQSELIEQAQKGFDYSKKTMALAEERKALEPLREQAEGLRKQHEEALSESLARLDAYTSYMETQVGQPPPITLAQQDAASYLAQKELYEARKGQLQQAFAESSRLRDEQARSRQAWINHKAEASEKVLKDTLPGWDNAMLESLAGYARDLGLTPESAQTAMLEPGFWQLAQKAKAYDALIAEKAKLKPVSQLTRVQKPSTVNQTPQSVRRQEAIKAHKARPSLDSLANLL